MVNVKNSALAQYYRNTHSNAWR